MTARRQPLTKSRIYATALQLIAQDGMARFSMRKLAQHLGVEAMALYKHVANKAALLDGVVVLLLEEIDVPTEGHWTTRLRGIAHSYRRLALAYPQLYPLLVMRPLPAESRPVLEEMWTVLAEAGLVEDRRLVALRTLTCYLVGFELSEIVGEAPTEAAELGTPAWLSRCQEHDVLFDQGLDVILAGLQLPQRDAVGGESSAMNVSFGEHPAG
jgi:AcrR family transcriptional regulator